MLPRGKKKTPPTTVRFDRHLHEWLQIAGERHPEGRSGVINDAVEFYRRHQDDHMVRIHKAIVGNGREDADTR